MGRRGLPVAEHGIRAEVRLGDDVTRRLVVRHGERAVDTEKGLRARAVGNGKGLQERLHVPCREPVLSVVAVRHSFFHTLLYIKGVEVDAILLPTQTLSTIICRRHRCEAGNETDTFAKEGNKKETGILCGSAWVAFHFFIRPFGDIGSGKDAVLAYSFETCCHLFHHHS